MKPEKKRLILITGGARSGKSIFAEKMAQQMGSQIAYIATAQALDKEMKERIHLHRQSRPEHWKTYEVPYQIAPTIAKIESDFQIILIDCLTLFISNLLMKQEEHSYNSQLCEQLLSHVQDTLEEITKCKATVIIVTNEVGAGLVPDNPMGRFFRDVVGKANQLIAASADQVYLLVSGIPVRIKG